MTSSYFFEPQPAAEAVIRDALRDATAANGVFRHFGDCLRDLASGRLIDWIDHVVLNDDDRLRTRLADAGFRPASDGTYRHHGARLPRIVLRSAHHGARVAVRVDNLSYFLQCQGAAVTIEGAPGAAVRRALVARENRVDFLAVERLCVDSAGNGSDADPLALLRSLEAWNRLPRRTTRGPTGFTPWFDTADALVRDLGRSRAAHVVCLSERNYWMSRNRAGRIQKMRQDVLGLGWGNHDHHTFRSSRENFINLIRLFSGLGFEKRERFYAGDEAGWGAQVMENEDAGIVLFLDVDLAPDEAAVDFADTPLAPLETPGTVGLWCALHGDSIFSAGLHHLAAGFAFSRLERDLTDAWGVAFMKPFSDFPYLRQAFSRPEHWTVPPARVRELARDGRITADQAERFAREGAIGSHLENIERNDGYRGFNRKNVSAIIRKTDPRR